ncbi:hypothetical protein [Campylobacter rectus]
MFFYRREIKFTSRCIEFIQKGKVKRRYRITKNHDMIRLFLQEIIRDWIWATRRLFLLFL